MSKWNRFVYSYVPKKALPSILEEGLYGGKALLTRPDLLEQAAAGRKTTVTKLKNKLEKDLEDPFFRPALLGPNITFQLIPDLKKMSAKHPVIVNKLVPIKINLSQLLSDFPGTKIFGMELKPSEENMAEKERHHFLSAKELQKLLAMSAKDLWSSYNDIDDKGLYAPDVPHASIHTKSGIIPAEYLKEIKHGEAIDELVKLASEYERMCHERY